MIELLYEFLGTFIFVYVILSTGSPIYIAISLCVILLLTNGSINPAVSLSLMMTGSFTSTNFIMYTIAELLGAAAAAKFYLSRNS